MVKVCVEVRLNNAPDHWTPCEINICQLLYLFDQNKNSFDLEKILLTLILIKN